MTNFYDVANGLSQDEPGPLEPVEIAQQPGAAPATGNTARDQEMYAAGIRTGEENAKHNAAIRAGVPDGWKLVPIEPTDAMLDTGIKQHRCEQGDPWYSSPDLGEGDCQDIYAAMLNAAPTAPDAPLASMARAIFGDQIGGQMDAMASVPRTLLSCPFCGGTRIFTEPDERGSGGQWVTPIHVGCNDCKAEQMADTVDEAVERWNRRSAAPGVSSVEQDERSATHGMTLGERIAHVGGRTNAQGYVEFGSPMAVDALIQHVLRDIDCTRQEDDGAYQARYRLPGGQWSSWGHVVCGVKGHEQELRHLPGERRPAPAAGDALDAARYRWLCDKFGITKLPCAIERIIEGSYVADGKKAIDAAIDAAIAAQRKGDA